MERMGGIQQVSGHLQGRPARLHPAVV